MRLALLCGALLLIPGCQESDDVRELPGTRLAFDPTETAGFFDAPFPLPTRVRDDNTLIVADFPNPQENALVARVLDALERSPVGFGTTSAVFFRFTGALHAGDLPDPAGSLAPGSPVFLVDVDPDSPTLDERVPVDVVFKAAAETYSPGNLLVILPRPGMVLRPGTRYAAVVTDDLPDAEGRPLGSPLALEQLKAGRAPRGPHGDALLEAFALLWDHLSRAGLPRAGIRGATVFRTGDPHREMDRLREYVQQQAPPAAQNVHLLEDHDTFCVVEGQVTVPIFQDGDRPYLDGGEIRFDTQGDPAFVDAETIRFAVSIPKKTMPASGWPLLFYSAGQGGAHVQFVHRGTFDEQQSIPGRGPALYLADVGIAALSIEAPLVGPRHPTGDTSGLEFFNVQNPRAFRDNTRQAAADFLTLVRLAPLLTVDASLCPGADSGGVPFTFDDAHFFFYGHSTGATVGSLVLGLEPTIRAGLLSGVGGSWLYNLTIKFEPMDFGGLVAVLLGYLGADTPDIHDPVLNLFQTFAEPSEPMNWASRWAREPGPHAAPRDILIIEGVVDGYFPPLAVNALALAARTEPVAPTVEDSLLDALTLIQGELQSTPAADNLSTSGTTVSSLLLQYDQPPGISGHYVPFELGAPKFQYKCFFQSAVQTGVATVPAADASPLAPCP